MDIRMKKITISKAGSSKAKIALAALAIVILAAAGYFFFFRTTVPKVSMSVILQETKGNRSGGALPVVFFGSPKGKTLL